MSVLFVETKQNSFDECVEHDRVKTNSFKELEG